MGRVGRAVKQFGRFWYDFVIGDDWTMAVGVVIGIVFTWGVVKIGGPAWMVMPLAVTALLGLSLVRARRAMTPVDPL